MGSSGSFVKNDRRRGHRNGTDAPYRRDELANWLRLVDWRPIPTYICAVVHDQAIESDGSGARQYAFSPRLSRHMGPCQSPPRRWWSTSRRRFTQLQVGDFRAPLDPRAVAALALHHGQTWRQEPSATAVFSQATHRHVRLGEARARILRRRPQALVRQRGRGPAGASRALNWFEKEFPTHEDTPVCRRNRQDEVAR
jgi:hypothetical protein